MHWRPGTSDDRVVSGLVDALADYSRCAVPLHALASVDSALRLRPDLRSELLTAGLLSDGVDGRCESGTEFMAWYRLLRALGARRQVRIPAVGRVDFMLGDRLIIEIDGREFHDTASTFESDRRRDAMLSALGYRVLRFSYAQVLGRWAEVEAAIRAALARGDHW
ncbi:endonuclease domain-containing protein [Microcella flavibacter]|uniref:endonuclease domain-containing protein n=1 Tax=Microcella flavibacter TaxID=1804990 RepID=UPI001E2D0991|nr:DUF559 domain-containing protein [Microcella flavibacter]